MNNELIFFLDQDGCLCDFVGGVFRLFPSFDQEKPWNPGEYDLCKHMDIPSNEIWRRIDACPTFWEDLEMLPEAIDLYNELSGLGRVIISTSPSLHPSCVAGKLKWLQRHFGYNFRDYMLGTHKELFAAPNRILIDDQDKNCEKFVECGGRAICYPQIWNSSHDVIELLGMHSKKQYIMHGIDLAMGATDNWPVGGVQEASELNSLAEASYEDLLKDESAA